MGISNVSGNAAQFSNTSGSARREQIQQRMAEMKSALTASGTQDQLKTDVVKLLDKMAQTFQSQPGTQLPQIQDTMSQFSTFLEHIDPSVFEDKADEIIGHKRKLKQPANTAFVEGLKRSAPALTKSSTDVEYPTHLVDEALKGELGAITALGSLKQTHAPNSVHGPTQTTDPFSGLPDDILDELVDEAVKGEMGAITALAALKSAYQMTDQETYQSQYDDNLPAAQGGDVVATQLVVQASVALGIDSDLSQDLVSEAIDEMIPAALRGNLGAITGLGVALAEDESPSSKPHPSGVRSSDVSQEELDQLYLAAEEGRMGAITALGVAESTATPESGDGHECQCAGKAVLTEAEQQVVWDTYYEQAVAGNMGAVAALSMVNWGLTAPESSTEPVSSNPVPKKIRSFAQLMLWFTQELMGVHSGDINAMMKASNGDMFGAVSTEMKVELEALIKQLLKSGHGIDDLEELKQIMALVGILGFNISDDLLGAIKDAIKDFIEENMGSMDIGKFVEFLQMVNAIVGPVLGKPPTDDAMIPEAVRQQLDAGISAAEVGSDNKQSADGILPNGDEVDPVDQAAADEEEDAEIETTPINPQALQQQSDNIIRSSSGKRRETSLDSALSSNQAAGDAQGGSDSGDDRGRGTVKDFALGLEEAASSAFESVAVQMLDVMNKVIISRIDPSLDQILEKLDLSGIDLDSFSQA